MAKRKVKAAHHRGIYHVTSRRVVAQARRDPSTRCWRCGRTLAEHPPGANGKPQYWTAGHIIDGVTAAGLAAETSRCNFAAGIRKLNARKRNTRRTDLTW